MLLITNYSKFRGVGQKDDEQSAYLGEGLEITFMASTNEE